jgi:hypothetical protein
MTVDLGRAWERTRDIIAETATSKASDVIPGPPVTAVKFIPLPKDRGVGVVKQGTHMLTFAVSFIA